MQTVTQKSGKPKNRENVSKYGGGREGGKEGREMAKGASERAKLLKERVEVRWGRVYANLRYRSLRMQPEATK